MFRLLNIALKYNSNSQPENVLIIYFSSFLELKQNYFYNKCNVLAFQILFLGYIYLYPLHFKVKLTSKVNNS